MKKNLLFQFLLIVNLFFAASCSDDDFSGELENSTTLNMLNRDNGSTPLGNSDIYITSANNFKTWDCLISEIGSSKGLGKVVPPKIGDFLLQEVAVTQGNLYQAFKGDAIRFFPSGTCALALAGDYYQFYVESPIVKENVTIGATVKFALVKPDANGLPEYGSEIGEVYSVMDIVVKEFPDDVEFFYESGIPEVFDLTIEKGRLQMSLKKTPTETNGLKGSYGIYVRRGNVYTRVDIQVK